MKSYFYFCLFLLGLSLAACSKTWQVARVTPQDYDMQDSLVESDPAILALIEPYKTSLDEKMNIVIGQVAKTLYKSTPESTLGNFMVELMYQRAVTLSELSIDFAVANTGGIRIPSLAEGPVTVGKIYELMPFDNQIVVMQLPGSTLQLLLNQIAARGGWPVSHQLRFVIKEDQATAVTINGQAIQPSQTYTIALPDFIANGGDDCFFLKTIERTGLGVLVRDAIIEHVRELTAQGKNVDADLTGRISREE